MKQACSASGTRRTGIIVNHGLTGLTGHGENTVWPTPEFSVWLYCLINHSRFWPVSVPTSLSHQGGSEIARLNRAAGVGGFVSEGSNSKLKKDTSCYAASNNFKETNSAARTAKSVT